MLRITTAHRCLCFLFLILFVSMPAFGKVAFESPVKGLFKFDPKWKVEKANPFVLKNDGYVLVKEIGAAYRMIFPKVLDSKSPIVINTKFGKVKQYLNTNETYQAELAGRYLVYRGKKQSILFRYDKEKNAFREFVYLPSEKSLSADGSIIRWRFEGAELSQREDGSVAFLRNVDHQVDLRNVADSEMAERINRFFEKKQGAGFSSEPVKKTLFIAPAPEYVDGKLNTINKGIHYKTQVSDLALVLEKDVRFEYPLWVDPTLTSDADADVILHPQGGGNPEDFGYSVASAGDFNGDGVNDVIVGARNADTVATWNAGKAYIFLGKKSGDITAPDDNADVVLHGSDDRWAFGQSVASAGDFNGDGKDDVIVGAPTDWYTKTGSA